MRRSKYNNKRVTLDGITFDSIRESKRYSELKLLVMGKQITGLECHPSLRIMINDVKICLVEADFAYFEKNKRVYEDVKTTGTLTQISKLKHRLVLAMYPGIDWRIVK